MHCGHLSDEVGTRAEQNTQNLYPAGGFTGPGLSDMKRLARHIRPPPTRRVRLQAKVRGRGNA